MQIEYMREFIAVANEKSISVAAQRLHLTQPVLSKHIRAIEDDLHNQLFFRSTKGITLTPQGRIAFESFSKIVNEYDYLSNAMAADESELCGQIRMGILTMGFDSYIGPIVHGFHQVHPNVSFSYVTRQPQNIIDGVINGSLDVGFTGDVRLKNKDSITFHKLGEDKLHFVVSKRSELASKETVSPADLAGHPLVCLQTHSTTDALNVMLDKAGYMSTRIIPTEEIEVVPMTLVESDGYFAIPDFMTSAFSSSEKVCIVDPADDLTLPVYFLHKATVNNPLVNTFLQWVNLRAQMAENNEL